MSLGILYINNAPFLGGAQITLRNIIRRLDVRRFRAVVAIPESSRALEPFFSQAGATVEMVPMAKVTPLTPRIGADVWRSVRALTALVRRHQIGVIHSNCQRGGLLGTLTKWRAGVPFIWTINDAGMRWGVRALTVFPDRVTCVSRAVYELFRCWPRGHFRMIYNGVEAETLGEEERESRRQRVREKLGIPRSAPVVGSVCRLVPYKGVHVIARAMEQVWAELPDAVFVHVGGVTPGYDGYAAGLRAALSKRPALFLDFTENVGQFYPAFDVLTHAPLQGRDPESGVGVGEAFGMSVAEAMAYGLPVVVTRSGGTPELVDEEVSGLVVKPGEVGGLASVLVELLVDAEARRRMGRAGHQRYLELFTQEREVRDFAELYLELAG